MVERRISKEYREGVKRGSRASKGVVEWDSRDEDRCKV